MFPSLPSSPAFVNSAEESSISAESRHRMTIDRQEHGKTLFATTRHPTKVFLKKGVTLNRPMRNGVV
jgi:hypothetical protein